MIVQLKRFVLPFCKVGKVGKVCAQFVRHDSSQASSKVLEHLNSRSLLRIRGRDASNFLQGLITNDMKHIEEGAANLYALFLNIKGRVMYDVIIYKSHEDDVFYIECDSKAVDPLQKHLKMYRVRRKIDIDNIENNINVWALFDTSQYLNKNDADNNIMMYEDPRLADLGIRILAESNIERSDIKKHLNFNALMSNNPLSYKAFRYTLGISEGVDDLPPGKPLPLEVNCDYLHGVSFHKGCYIGQELTARTYHTGVVRKRIMPLLFEELSTKSFSYDEKIIDESGNVVGKFRGNEKEHGLGLMRITEALNAKSLTMLDMKLKISKPIWWPQEIQKESASANKKS
ncbi:Putative transferase CAF17, mitochondrial [Dufourea novaeangliae]|uniref:Putative transferase CAF17, mitochondrial n=1 Tax=Dufourea novaeangliae TaxID=178035 RepID=A0A154P2U7_DUFNO|nr:Putative transferase CAF17, mitochondrial [Dufourea novaeangliae]